MFSTEDCIGGGPRFLERGCRRGRRNVTKRRLDFLYTIYERGRGGPRTRPLDPPSSPTHSWRDSHSLFSGARAYRICYRTEGAHARASSPSSASLMVPGSAMDRLGSMLRAHVHANYFVVDMIMTREHIRVRTKVSTRDIPATGGWTRLSLLSSHLR